jgi:hypothetical protein
MKNFVIILSFILCPFLLYSQDKPMNYTFEQFEEWMKTLKPSGISFTETGKNGDEYMATFLKENTMIGITMSPLGTFDSYKKLKGVTPYVRKGYRTVFYGTQNFWNIKVEAKNINACFEVTTVYMEMKKADLEKILDETGLYEINKK